MFQIILLAVFGALAVAGVMVFAFAVGGDRDANTIGKVVIWGTFDKAAFNTVLEQAMQANPDLQQVSYVHKDSASYEQDLLNALAQKTGPDMFILRSDYAVKNEPKISSTPYDQISQVEFQTAFVDATDVYLGPRGVIGIPFAIDPLVLYWNKDLLGSAGYALPPQTWDEVQDVVQKVTVRDSSGQIKISGIALGTYQNIEDAKAILSALIGQKGVSITARGSTGLLTSALASSNTAKTKQPAVEALGFYTQFADPSHTLYSWDGAKQNARAAFAAGDVALYLGFASEAPLIVSMNPNLNGGIAAFPQFTDAQRKSDFGHAYAFAVPIASSNPHGALVVAELLVSATTSTAFAHALGIAPAGRDALALPASGHSALYNKMAIITHIWSDPDPIQTDNLFRAMIEGTISGAASVAQAIQNGDQQMAQIIGQ